MSHLNSLKPLGKGASQSSVVPVAQDPLHLLPLVFSTGHILLEGLQGRSQKLVAPFGQHRSHLGLQLLPDVRYAVRDAVRNAGVIVQSGSKKSRALCNEGERQHSSRQLRCDASDVVMLMDVRGALAFSMHTSQCAGQASQRPAIPCHSKTCR